MAKRYPVQRQAKAKLASAGTQGMISAKRFMSRLNRRLYRQSRYYEMKIDLDLPQADTGPVQVFVLRDTWGHQKAYQMAYDMFLKTTEEERSRLSPKAVARWLDFEVDHGTGVSELLPVVTRWDAATTSMVDSNLTIGEFNLTQVEDKNGNTMTFSWGVGTAGSVYNIVDEYGLSGNTDDQPTTTTEDTPYEGQLADTSDVETNQLKNRGNDAPYSSSSFGNPWVKVATLRRTPGEQKLSTGFFTAPCGFVLVTGLDPVQETQVNVEFKKGDYKGIHAPSILDV